MATIATLNPSDVLDTVAKLLRLLEKELVEWSDYRSPIDSKTARRNLAAFLKLGCPRIKNDGTVVATPAVYEKARFILGQDFITPEEIVAAGIFKFSLPTGDKLAYSDEQCRDFVDNLPPEEVIQWCQRNGFMVVAGPPRPLSLKEIEDLQRFGEHYGGWYLDQHQRFSRRDQVEPGWLMLRKGLVPNSGGKTRPKQLQLISDTERVPNSAELAWGLTAYKATRHINLLRGVNARTSSLPFTEGYVVTVGMGSSRIMGGIVISSVLDDKCDDNNLGLASVRKAKTLSIDEEF